MSKSASTLATVVALDAFRSRKSAAETDEETRGRRLFEELCAQADEDIAVGGALTIG
jgi:hypothetical protein